MAANNGDIRYLTPLNIDTPKPNAATPIPTPIIARGVNGEIAVYTNEAIPIAAIVPATVKPVFNVIPRYCQV